MLSYLLNPWVEIHRIGCGGAGTEGWAGVVGMRALRVVGAGCLVLVDRNGGLWVGVLVGFAAVGSFVFVSL